MKGDHYDVVVIGMGPAGMASAGMAQVLGLKTLGIDTRPSVGGECLNVGCIPSKAFLRFGKRNFAAHKGKAEDEPLTAGEKIVDQTQERLKFITEKKFGKMIGNVELALESRATFINKKTVRITSLTDPSERTVTFKRAYICTGTRPFIPHIDGAETIPKDKVLTNENIFNIEPADCRGITIIGGSAIAVEMAQAFGHMGVKVTIVQRSAVLCRAAGCEAGEILEKELLKIPNMEIIHCDPMKKLSMKGDDVVLSLDSGREIHSEYILYAAGRKADPSGLNLEAAKVKTDKRGFIKVDKYLRSSNKSIFGVGDINSHALFSHAAMHQGMLAIMNSMMPFFARFNFRKYAVPSTIFTSPPISQVGLTPETAGKTKFVTLRGDYSDYGAAIAEKVETGFIELYLKPGMTGRILGARIVGEGGGEMINEVAALIQKKGSMLDIMFTQHSFPTMSFQFWQLSNNHMKKYMNTHPKMRKMAKMMF